MSNSSRSLILLFGIGALIVGIIIAIPLLFDFSNYNEQAYKYNYFEFVEKEGIWTSKVQEGSNLYLTALRHGPKELEDIPVSGNIMEFRNSNEFFYITFDPTPENHNGFVTISNAEISTNLVIHFGKDLLPACTVEDPVCTDSNVSIITCDNTEEAVIFINRAVEASVVIDGNCATISGMDNDLVRAADRFMYGMYGIMQ